MEKDVRVLISEKGFPSMLSFSKAAGINNMTLRHAIESPKGLGNTSHQNFRAIANTLGMTCDELWDWLHSDN